MHILITGAAGSGTSTLGKALAKELNASFLEADDFYWLETNPPFTKKRLVDERRRLIMSSLENYPNAIVSGSVMKWGEQIEDAFDVIIFLYVEAHIRLKRLREREIYLFGVADADFPEWAAQYDQGTAPGRSLARHRSWLEQRSCPVIKLEGAKSVSEQIEYLRRKGLTNYFS
ncbi:AAA family ATPase [Halomonas sp. ISL-60]|uniref:AAA family ATPase n=1 Tax=Halomonas sp. ISL-56 TaxID=2819149 RepID=UPI001BE6A0BE|nr:AAA family ATPase [Halomonas sp. ISL-56]MBT2774279.1 AAA family ATPase [Halomonas sp. ISL-60]MBT2803069.1 AAA family ATPase [Halomonas sp. ISL-56]